MNTSNPQILLNQPRYEIIQVTPLGGVRRPQFFHGCKRAIDRIVTGERRKSG
jgi:hypothetical protein